jgi:hypothetical protein
LNIVMQFTYFVIETSRLENNNRKYKYNNTKACDEA